MYQLVVVGTSLGGLNALRCLLSGLPEDFPLPVVIAQHRTKDGGQGLAMLLASSTSLRIIEPHDKQEIVPGIVYLAPADYHLLLESGYFTLSTEPPLHCSRPSIDVLFESAADAYGSSLIGIVLTGANADGREGAASIKRHGGFVIAQDPSSAEARAMPEAAIAAGADRVLPLPEIASVLARLARPLSLQPRLGAGMRREEQPCVLVVDDDDNNLLAYSGILQGLDLQLVTARSGHEALKEVLREEFAVIVMDVNMPRLDGFETATLIRQREKSQATPLIFATASFNEESQVFRGYSLGAVDYLIKPLVPEVLRSKIGVFVELFKKTRQIIRQAEQLRAAEEKEHQETLRQERENWETERLRQELIAEKQHHESLQLLNIELENRLLQLDQANRELAQKNQENEMFVYSASHDLRSPLINLQAFSQELGSMCRDVRQILAACDSSDGTRERGLTILDAGMSESIGFIQTAVTRLSTIINALLRLSRAGRVEYAHQEVDVQALVKRIVESMNSIVIQRQAELVLKDLPPAWGDPTAIEQIFANLIGNALNYLDPARPGLIEVGGTDVAQHRQIISPVPRVIYYVKDNGLGIPPAHQPQVFQAFKRLHPEAAPGEGMGLATVQRIVERHRGQVWLESQAGVGTVFYVALPSSPALVVTGGREITSGQQSEQGRSFSDERIADYSLS